VEEQNWVQLTQSQFDPIRITDRLWIVPSWHEAPAPDAINLILDPGMAFGTGSHPTTRMCLEWLTQEITPGITVLDYGCGSGILGIAASRLGAGPVTGVDIDEQAVRTAADNAANNGVELLLQVSAEPLDGTFERVVANILTNPLKMLAPLLSARVAPGGKLALAGVLESQAQEVIDAYTPFISLHVGATLDGWVRLEGHRPA
jgi:ribosomal protein L11 methyltransferase